MKVASRRGWRAALAAGLLLSGGIATSIGCVVEPIPDPYDKDTTPAPPVLKPITHKLDDPCDGYDNNGDGRIDEECYCDANKSQWCYPGPAGSEDVGACRFGVQQCTNISVDFQLGSWGECIGAIVPRVEICGNNIDEDCDGEAPPCDECDIGTTQPCYGGPAGSEGEGICSAGIQLCHTGSWGECKGVQLPLEEVCGNGIDEDCDGYDQNCDPGCTPGAVETCYPGPENTMGVGECKAGQRLCENSGLWGDCHGAVLPEEEICNNDLDEDCNSVVDDCG